MTYDASKVVLEGYMRIYCYKCHMPICWNKIKDHDHENCYMICNLCRLDEWWTLRWLGFVNRLLPETAVQMAHDTDAIDERMKENANLIQTIDNIPPFFADRSFVEQHVKGINKTVIKKEAKPDVLDGLDFDGIDL